MAATRLISGGIARGPAAAVLPGVNIQARIAWHYWKRWDQFNYDKVDCPLVTPQGMNAMTCEEEYSRMMEAPAGSNERSQREADFYECMRFMLSIYEARGADAASRTVEQYEKMKRVMEATAALTGKLKPRPPKDFSRSREVRNQIFSDTKTAMLFSNALTDAFHKSHIDLKENEMFECTISLRERPAQISELLSLSRAKGVPPMNFITDSATMAQVMKEMQKDRIK
jgi:hypothetical protein